MIDVGIVGCGTVVRENYVRTLVGRPEYRVRFVCDTNPEQAAATAELLGAEVVALDRLVADAKAIIVTTPPSTHASIVRQCLLPERVVLCEKPFTPRYEDAVELAELARAAGAKLYVGQFRRAFPQLQLARRLIRQGAIGRVNGFVASEGGRFGWRAVSGYTTSDPAGGVLWDTGSHTLDMVLFGASLDGWQSPTVRVGEVQRDKPEPSHDLTAAVSVSDGDDTVEGRLHLSRREGLPNLVRIFGERGEVALSVGLDDRVRVTGGGESTIVLADRRYSNLLECFDLETRRVLLDDGAHDFAAETVLGQIKVLEEVARA